MGGFWESDDGDDLLEGATGEFDSGGGNLDPIPDGTNVLAHVEEVKWDENQNGDGFISIKWRVQKPDDYGNRVVFHKLWVTDDDPSAKDAKAKREKAKRMLAAIDANAGGKLARSARRPSDDDMMLALANKAMVLKLGVWETGGKTGNWVMAVFPKASWAERSKSQPEAPARKASSGRSFNDDLDDDSDIPF